MFGKKIEENRKENKGRVWSLFLKRFFVVENIFFSEFVMNIDCFLGYISVVFSATIKKMENKPRKLFFIFKFPNRTFY